jgi:hypothetical protein
MKKFLAILVLGLLLLTSSQADDIKDFQIEGMSIEDSLLDFFNEDEIKLFINDNNAFSYKEKKYVQITTHAKNIEPYAEAKDDYDYVGVAINPSDKKYKIHLISAYLNYDNDIEGCKKKKKEIVSSISSAFENAKKK